MKKRVWGGSLLVVFGLLLGVVYFTASRCLFFSDAASDAPLRVVIAVRLSASPEAVFDYVAGKETLPEWMPGLSSLNYNHNNSVISDQLNVGSKRLMVFDGQLEIEEIVQFDRPGKLAYRIVEGVPINSHLAVLTIKENGPESSVLTWEQYFNIKRSAPVGWLMPFLVRGFMREAQDNLITQLGGEVISSGKCLPLP